MIRQILTWDSESRRFSKENVTSYRVGFQTPFGTFEELQQAQKRCLELDLDPDIMIEEVVIAYSSNGYQIGVVPKNRRAFFTEY